jgi:copper oxidase (laccase) domain-containing protein
MDDNDWRYNRSDVLIETEAAFSEKRHTFFMLSTADCLPVVFTDKDSGFYGIAHFGWRNLMEDFPENLIVAIGRQFGVLPGHIIVGIGPAIGPCCYRFENPVQRSDPIWKPFLEKRSDGRVAIDLVKAFKNRMAACGIWTENLFDIELCTGCNNALFFSCYRDGYLSGRFPSIVGFI